MSTKEMLWFRRSITTAAVAGCLFMIGIFSASAQPAPPYNELSTTLKLTTKQTPEVQAIVDAERREMQVLREAMRTKVDALHEATKQKLCKVLNAEQMGRYAEWREANRPPRPEGGPPPRRGGGEELQAQSQRRPAK